MRVLNKPPQHPECVAPDSTKDCRGWSVCFCDKCITLPYIQLLWRKNVSKNIQPTVRGKDLPIGLMYSDPVFGGTGKVFGFAPMYRSKGLL